MAILSFRTTAKFNPPPLIKVSTVFLLILSIMSIAIQFFVYKHGQKWQPKCVVNIVFIDNLGFKVLMVNSGSKHAFKYGQRH